LETRAFDPASITAPLIYESHVGMAGEEPRVHTYREFADSVLPRIAKAGYNTVQLMAVQEHPYYGSFGYHVSSFFAAVLALRHTGGFEIPHRHRPWPRESPFCWISFTRTP
jgi:hypothetical protein